MTNPTGTLQPKPYKQVSGNTMEEVMEKFEESQGQKDYCDIVSSRHDKDIASMDSIIPLTVQDHKSKYANTDRRKFHRSLP